MSNDAHVELLERDSQHLIHPLHSAAGHSSAKVWVGGQGATLVDANGDEYLDGLSGLWNNTAGNGCQELVDAGSKQLGDLAYVSGYTGSSNPRAIELAEKLARICYPQINHFYFTSGGGESTDSNIKMARYYWKLKGRPEKTKVVSGAITALHWRPCLPPESIPIGPCLNPASPGSRIFLHRIRTGMKPTPLKAKAWLRRMNWKRKFSRKAPIPSRCLLANRYRAQAV